MDPHSDDNWIQCPLVSRANVFWHVFMAVWINGRWHYVLCGYNGVVIRLPAEILMDIAWEGEVSKVMNECRLKSLPETVLWFM